MRTHKILVFYALLVLTLCATTCRKDNGTSPDPTVYTPLDKDFLSYFAFPKGSWWVYKEIHTGAKDSFYVQNYSIDNIDYTKGNQHYQSLSYELIGGKYHGWGAASPLPPQKDTIFCVYSDNYDGVDGFNHSSIRFFYPCTFGLRKGQDIYIKTHYDTLSILGILFSDVYVTAYSSQVYVNPIKSEYYCKNVGIIRREFFDGTTYELIKYHLNK